jgi:3-dehydroquinate synthase
MNDHRFCGDDHIWLDAIETDKSLSSVERIICELRERGMSRGDHLTAVGGGIIQDVSTLVASLYMRGVTWTYVPTTLLGMVDSCIGGKSSINTQKTKNLIGNIYPPSEVVIDTDFVTTLPPREKYSGIAEALKITYCGGEASFQRMTSLLKDLEAANIGDIIHLSLTTKKWFIEIDEHDTAERLQLNFGHTFGHAIESATNFAVPHGLAVAIGMICASEFASHHGRVHSCADDLNRISRDLVRKGLRDSSRFNFDVDRFSTAFRSDKKHPAGAFRLVLPSKNPGVRLTVMERTPTIEQQLEEIVTAVIGEVSK